MILPAAAQQTMEGAAHIVQLAITPVFLLSGIAALLNVFASRLGRVADQTDRLACEPKSPTRDTRLKALRFRTTCLDWAVVLGALAGALTCATILMLFLGTIGVQTAGEALFLVFGGGVILTLGALFFFVLEMLLAAASVRSMVARSLRGGPE